MIGEADRMNVVWNGQTETHQPITPIRINMMYDASADSAFKIVGQNTTTNIVSDTILKVIWEPCVCARVAYAIGDIYSCYEAVTEGGSKGLMERCRLPYLL